MAFQARTETRPPAAGFDGTVWVLEETEGTARAEIAPSLGFNCFRWEARRGDKVLDLLYADPEFLRGGRPTRSGIPILVPFPNRIRDGRFTWDGKTYELPRNDNSGRNAIHGFACRSAWRVTGSGADATSAWVTGEFQLSRDNPEARDLWPADFRIAVTYRLAADSLRLETVLDNPDRVPLPFGLGFHPYFRLPLVQGSRKDDCLVQAPAATAWELQDSLPTGRRLPPGPDQELREPRPFGGLSLDALLTDLPRPGPDGLRPHGTVSDPAGALLEIRASAPFRELVAFTPPHREAVCLEPYTCATDAINLEQRGVDAGLLVLQPGERWGGAVEMKLGDHPA